MRLQVGGLVGHQAVAERVTLVERIVGEGFDDVEQFLPQRPPVTGVFAPIFECLSGGGHDLAALLAHRLAQVVGFGQRVAGKLLRHAHHALLIDHQAVRVAQHLPGILVEVLDWLALVLTIRVVVVHVHRHRTRAVEGHERGDVVERGGCQRAHQRPHRRRFQLEHAHRVAALQQLEDLEILQRHRVDVERGVFGGPHHGHRVGDDVEVAQPQEVHLQQTEFLDAMHLVLGDDRGVFGLAAGFRLPLNGQVVGERLFGDHHCCGVNPVASLETFEPTGHLHDALHIGVGFDHCAQFGGSLVPVGVFRVFLKAVLQRGVAAHHQRWHCLSDLVAHSVGVAQHARCVANCVAGLDGAERDDLRDVVAAVTLGRIADHLVAITRVEVHVDIGHGDTAGVEEPFEQQVVLDRVEIGDAQAVRHRATGGRTTSGADPDTGVLGVLDEIPHDEEVRGKPHVLDDL
ncbi:unannotated protein [freshwater metagenome]|uniref:Unannotated protein n=1 Tax=freshwater metagenome TaxID=449393 RepID=A0A6J7C5H4_9ZZZZ